MTKHSIQSQWESRTLPEHDNTNTNNNTNTNTAELVWRPLQTEFGQGRLTINTG